MAEGVKYINPFLNRPHRTPGMALRDIALRKARELAPLSLIELVALTDPELRDLADRAAGSVETMEANNRCYLNGWGARVAELRAIARAADHRLRERAARVPE